MLKLTSLLVGGIVITMAYAGRDLPTDTTSGPAVTRAQTADMSRPVGLKLSDDRGAIDMAVAATNALAAPAFADDPSNAQAVNAALQTALGDAEPAVYTADAEATDDKPATAWRVNATSVNLRQGPSTANAVVGRVSEGDSLQVMSQTDDGWIRVRRPGGAEAYIYGSFLDRAG